MMSDHSGLGLVDEESVSVQMDRKNAKVCQIHKQIHEQIHEQKDDIFKGPEDDSASLTTKQDLNKTKKESIDNISLNSATLVSYHQDANRAETREHDANNILNNIASEIRGIGNISKYSKLSGRHLMTVENEIEEINVCKDQKTADDYQSKATIKYKPKPDDELLDYALKCKNCQKEMIQEYNIHTNGLLFEFYKCKCSIINKHIIVLDKRMEGYVLHQSKGISNFACKIRQKHILECIILSSRSICFAKRMYRELGITELLVDLIVDKSLVVGEHTIDAYNRKLHDVDIELKHIRDTRQLLTVISSTSQHTDGDQAIRINHRLRHVESNRAAKAFDAWLRRYIYESNAKTLRSCMPAIYSYFAGFVTFEQMDEFNYWMDQYARLMCSMADMLDQIADRKIEVSDATAAMIHELMLHGDADNMPITEQYEQVIQAYADMYQEPISDDDCDSTSMVDYRNNNERSVDILSDDQDDLMTSNMSKTEVKKFCEVVSTDFKNAFKFKALIAKIKQETTERNPRKAELEHKMSECTSRVAEPENEMDERKPTPKEYYMSED